MSGRAAAGGWPTAATRPVVLLGHPAGHSLSPPIHNAAFTHDGLDLVYLALDVAPDRLAVVLEALAAMGAVGANVTVPHKRAALAACDTLSDEARLVGAVNTLVFAEDGRLHGDNTDALGLLDAWSREIAGPLEGAPVVLLGTGGAARATAVTCGRLGARVQVVGRDVEAAGELAELATRAGAHAQACDLADTARVAAVCDEARLLVNATPLGMAGESLPPPFMALRADQIAYDLVYEPARTPFLVAADHAGAANHHGLGMLVGQAAVAYERWTGRPAPRAVMSRAANEALAARAGG